MLHYRGGHPQSNWATHLPETRGGNDHRAHIPSKCIRPTTQGAAQTRKYPLAGGRARPADERQCPLCQGTPNRHDFKNEREPLRTGQNPFAAVLGCADSRIAPEYCFDTGRGDVFVCRVAGNFASDESVASLEYAVQVLNTPLIFVLGHDACGAVDATVKSIRDGTTLPGHLPSLVAAISPAVKAVKDEPGDILENATRRNVMLNVQKLRAAGPILNKFVDDKKVRVVGGIYKLAFGKVELLV